jgi:acetyl-CoA carboxylase carboxyltransferase component
VAKTREPKEHARPGTENKLGELERLREEALHSGDEKAVARQRKRGKLLARERLEKLLDPGSFVELE